MDESSSSFLQFEKNQREYESVKNKISFWIQQFSKLQKDLNILAEIFQKIYEETEIRCDLPNPLQEQLNNRREGLRLSVKVANRLPSKLPTDLIVPEELECVQQENLLEQMKVYLEQLEKKFAVYIEKSVAPVLDGLYSGLIFSTDLQDQVNQDFPTEAEYVALWLSVYTNMLNIFKELLKRYSVGLLIPTRDSYFDEHKHEPIATMPDESLTDEQIKEVVRYGYIYCGELLGQNNFLIRPAQVIVVKN